jgi:NAD(P)-dependent dehydrogenase (short-subunit alcohol dehydrogenase family)
MKKVVLVTGSNKGIGLEIVRQLAKLGHEIIMGSRSSGNGKQAMEKLMSENLQAHPVTLDVTSGADIRQAADSMSLS